MNFLNASISKQIIILYSDYRSIEVKNIIISFRKKTVRQKVERDFRSYTISNHTNISNQHYQCGINNIAQNEKRVKSARAKHRIKNKAGKHKKRSTKSSQKIIIFNDNNSRDDRK